MRLARPLLERGQIGVCASEMSIVATPHPLSQTYPAVPESVPVIRRGLVAFAREAAVDEEQIDALRLAISEAATNVVRHAYDGGEGLIHVSAAIASDELWV